MKLALEVAILEKRALPVQAKVSAVPLTCQRVLGLRSGSSSVRRLAVVAVTIVAAGIAAAAADEPAVAREPARIKRRA